jgi:hypothetical protein
MLCAGRAVACVALAAAGVVDCAGIADDGAAEDSGAEDAGGEVWGAACVDAAAAGCCSAGAFRHEKSALAEKTRTAHVSATPARLSGRALPACIRRFREIFSRN